MMDNEKKFIFERDYTLIKDSAMNQAQELVKELCSSRVLEEAALFSKLPHIISEQGKRDYELLFLYFNEFVKERCGKIKGCVDYEKFDAFIKIELPFIEFCETEELMLLKETCKRAFCICFEKKKDTILMTIFVKYFKVR